MGPNSIPTPHSSPSTGMYPGFSMSETNGSAAASAAIAATQSSLNNNSALPGGWQQQQLQRPLGPSSAFTSSLSFAVPCPACVTQRSRPGQRSDGVPLPPKSIHFDGRPTIPALVVVGGRVTNNTVSVLPLDLESEAPSTWAPAVSSSPLLSRLGSGDVIGLAPHPDGNKFLVASRSQGILLCWLEAQPDPSFPVVAGSHQYNPRGASPPLFNAGSGHPASVGLLSALDHYPSRPSSSRPTGVGSGDGIDGLISGIQHSRHGSYVSNASDQNNTLMRREQSPPALLHSSFPSGSLPPSQTAFVEQQPPQQPQMDTAAVSLAVSRSRSSVSATAAAALQSILGRAAPANSGANSTAVNNTTHAAVAAPPTWQSNNASARSVDSNGRMDGAFMVNSSSMPGDLSGPGYARRDNEALTNTLLATIGSSTSPYKFVWRQITLDANGPSSPIPFAFIC
eukprot:GILI01017245.1.p1 GENE.GILI01017245.1~~GILI01017245.1.p1  ORF type:complete len:528 (-),score=82.23 GILI01017245.1:76-1434(-)